MKIESRIAPGSPSTAGAIESLDSRFTQALGQSAGGAVAAPQQAAFERLYRRLSALQGQGEKAHYALLQGLRSEDGTTRLYPDAQALLAVTQQLLARLKEDGLQQSTLYKEIKGANGLAFNMQLAVLDHMRDVFQPMDDEAREKIEW